MTDSASKDHETKKEKINRKYLRRAPNAKKSISVFNAVLHLQNTQCVHSRFISEIRDEYIFVHCLAFIKKLSQ